MAATGRSAGAALRIRSPSTVCCRTKLHSSGIERAGLGQYRLGKTDLADVVQRGRTGELVQLLAGQAEPAANREREPCDPVGARRQVRLVGTDDLEEDVVGLLARTRMTPVLARIHALVGELERIVDRARLVWEQDRSA